jgi:hypothetical protein
MVRVAIDKQGMELAERMELLIHRQQEFSPLSLDQTRMDRDGRPT